MEIADDDVRQAMRQCLPVELGIVTGARHGADIHNLHHSMLLQQLNELLQSSRGVADGQNER
jgi:hypothetical protein